MGTSLKKSILFILGTAWITATRAFDIYSTYQFTPDLKKEANPLVTVAGIDNWILLISIISLLSLYVIYAWYAYIHYTGPSLPETKNLNFSDFIGHYYIGKPAKSYHLLFSLPKSTKRFHQFIGIIMAPALMFAGLISTLMWIAINNQWEWYQSIHSPALIWSIILLGSFLYFLYYCRRQYDCYLYPTKYRIE